MIPVNVKNDGKHGRACSGIRRESALEGTGDFFPKGILAQAPACQVRPTTRLPRPRQPGKPGKIERFRLVEQVALP